jgi:hypothetical protein
MQRLQLVEGAVDLCDVTRVTDATTRARVLGDELLNRVRIHVRDVHRAAGPQKPSCNDATDSRRAARDEDDVRAHCCSV